ncbi:hypothetical protein LguiA_012902 [Lonicera macranthoides]
MVKELNVVVASSKELGLKSALTSQVEKMDYFSILQAFVDSMAFFTIPINLLS